MNMKKILALVLVAVSLLGMVACSINKTEVSVLWSGDGVVRVPDSLINAMERAMYIENIKYTHYGANGDQNAQTAKVQEVLANNCSGLVVELVDTSAAQTIVDLAKAKNVPLVFINSNVDASVLISYDKCASVISDEASVTTVLGNKIAESLSKQKDYEKADLNKDGKITYLALGEVTEIVDVANAALQSAGRNALEKVNASSLVELTVKEETVKKTQYGRLVDKDGMVIEMIISDDDIEMLNDLVSLQEKGFNADKLKTHFVPVYTVGADADYKNYVFGKLPEISKALSDANLDKESKIPQEVLDAIRGQSNLIKLSTLEKWKDLEAAVYTTRNVIGDGRLTNAAAVDFDGLAGAAAGTMAKLLKGESLDKTCVAVAYTTIK